MGNLLMIPVFLPEVLFRSTKKDSWKNNLLTSRIHSSLISISHSQTSQKYVGTLISLTKTKNFIPALWFFWGRVKFMPSANGHRPVVKVLRSSLHLRSLQRWCRSWQSFRSVSSGNKKTQKTETKKVARLFLVLKMC